MGGCAGNKNLSLHTLLSRPSPAWHDFEIRFFMPCVRASIPLITYKCCNYQTIHVIDTWSFPGATEPLAEFLCCTCIVFCELTCRNLSVKVCIDQSNKVKKPRTNCLSEVFTFFDWSVISFTARLRQMSSVLVSILIKLKSDLVCVYMYFNSYGDCFHGRNF